MECRCEIPQDRAAGHVLMASDVQAITIAKIAQVLHVSTDYLSGLKEQEEGDWLLRCVSLARHHAVF
jgi:AraC-like DNA-binding protein